MSKKALRKDFYMEIRKSMGRFLSIFFIVAIGVAFFSGIRSSEPDMRLSGDAYFDEKNLMDLQIISTLGLTQDDVDAICQVKGIKDVEAGYSTDVLCKSGDSQKVVHIMSLLPTMNQVTVEEGRLPKDTNECVLDIDYYEANGYKIGDEITFSSGTKDAITDSLKYDTYKIVGTVSSPTYVSFGRGNTTIGTGTINGFACVLEESFTMDAYSEIYATVEGAKKLTAFTKEYDNRVDEVEKRIEKIKTEREDARYEEVLDEAETRMQLMMAQTYQVFMNGQDGLKSLDDEMSQIPKAKWYIYDREHLVEYSGYGENADRMRAIGKVFPVLFFLMAALISLTTMTRMVEEQRTLIGTMKALGYSKVSIAGKYIGYASLATILGCVFGALFGEKVFPYIIIKAYGIIYTHVPNIEVPYNLYYAGVASAAAVFCVLFATVTSCYKELREQAAQLMRPPAPKQGKRVLLERIPFIWKRLSFTWKSTVRNLVRYKKRFFMTSFGIGGCMALLLFGFGLHDSIVNIGILQYEDLQLFDADLILNEEATDTAKQEITDSLKSDGRIKHITQALQQQVTIKKDDTEKEVYLTVFEPGEENDSLFVYQNRVTKEQYKLTDDGVILTEKIADKLGVKPGDSFTVEKSGEEDVTVTVSAICENYMRHYMYMTSGLYEQLYGKAVSYNSIFYTVNDGQREVAEEIGEEALKKDGALSVSYTRDYESQIEDMLGSLNMVIVVLVISAGLLAFVVLYNLNNINITERKRELATLKVLGFYPKEVAEYVYRENILLTVLGSVVGGGLGKILHRFIIETVEVDSAMFGRNIDLSSYIFGFLITIGFSMFVNGVMYFKLKKIDMVESLKSVE